jgi:phenylpyruvate tautomerase PptA (4-oxalocrotonate tautomerase family)
VLTNAAALDREKQLAAVAELPRVASEAANDPSRADRTWVLLTASPDGGWGLGGHAYLNEELIAAARTELGRT